MSSGATRNATMVEQSSNVALDIMRHICAHSPAIAALGLDILHASPGNATLALTLRPEMLNAQGIGYGGTIFSLGDTTAALAALSRNRLAVTQHASITYLEAARGDERLVAAAAETMRSARAAVYDVTITVGERMIALVRANFRILEPAVL